MTLTSAESCGNSCGVLLVVDQGLGLGCLRVYLCGYGSGFGLEMVGVSMLPWSGGAPHLDPPLLSQP